MIHRGEVFIVRIREGRRSVSFDQPNVSGHSIDWAKIPPKFDVFNARRGTIEYGPMGSGICNDVSSGEREIPEPAVSSCIVCRQLVVVLHAIHFEGKSDLFQITQALYSACSFFCLGESRKQHAREDGDNGNDDQKFDQCEPSSEWRVWDSVFHVVGGTVSQCSRMARTEMVYPRGVSDSIQPLNFENQQSTIGNRQSRTIITAIAFPLETWKNPIRFQAMDRQPYSCVSERLREYWTCRVEDRRVGR